MMASRSLLTLLLFILHGRYLPSDGFTGWSTCIHLFDKTAGPPYVMSDVKRCARWFRCSVAAQVGCQCVQTFHWNKVLMCCPLANCLLVCSKQLLENLLHAKTEQSLWLLSLVFWVRANENRIYNKRGSDFSPAVDPPENLKVLDPGHLGPLQITWSPPISLINMTDCQRWYQLEYFDTYSDSWSVSAFSFH